MSETLDRIRTNLIGLRMPRALEALDHTVRRIERGELTALEAIDGLLAEEHANAQLGVVATLPVQHESDLVLLNTGDDLVQHRAENAFARRRARVWVVPAAVEVSA